MIISTDFPGGNIKWKKCGKDTYLLEPDMRDSAAQWFYWAVCVQGKKGETAVFKFADDGKIGRFGAAMSLDLKSWRWLKSDSPDSFSYTFGVNECVYFAHDILYNEKNMKMFAQESGLTERMLCTSEKGRIIPYFTCGSGKEKILLTARHHACESTGSYVAEGVISELIRCKAPYEIIYIPFVDYDGVTDGDQGKARVPHDHNRDYGEISIYNSVKAVKKISQKEKIAFAFDFHSPLHMGGRSDHCYIVHKTRREAEKLFSKAFEKLSENDLIPYESEWDMQPGEGWNKVNEPPQTFAEYMNKFSEARLSFTLETPYFGLMKNGNSAEAMRTVGKRFAEALENTVCKF